MNRLLCVVAIIFLLVSMSVFAQQGEQSVPLFKKDSLTWEEVRSINTSEGIKTFYQ